MEFYYRIGSHFTYREAKIWTIIYVKISKWNNNLLNNVNPHYINKGTSFWSTELWLLLPLSKLQL